MGVLLPATHVPRLQHPMCPALQPNVSQAYLDVKEEGCREHRGASDGAARVNPANVVTGDRRDANLYAVYLVHEARTLTPNPNPSPHPNPRPHPAPQPPPQP